MTTPVNTAPGAAAFLDTTIPNTARIFDYLAGGAANFEADRQAAGEMLKLIPSLRKWVRLRRAFIQEAARRLYAAGFRQFLDLASGMPTEDHVHTFAPDARVVYSDINPVAVSYGDSLFADLVNVAYIRGNARELPQLLTAREVRRLIDRQEKVAIGLNALFLFLGETASSQVSRQLYAWAAPGSRLFLVFQTKGEDAAGSEPYRQFVKLTQQAYLPIQLHTLAENLAFTVPWQPVLVEPITQFLGLPDDFITEADQEGIGMAFYAAILEKPAAYE